MLDFLIFIFGVTGATLLIFKNKIGFIAFIVHSALWAVLSASDGNYYATLTCIIFILIDSYGYYKWRKEEDGH